MAGWILISVVAIILAWCYFNSQRKTNLTTKPIPGPIGLPILGNLFQLDNLQHVTLSNWAKLYGPVYQLKVANIKMVVISDYKILKECFSQSVFSGRIDLTLFDFILDGKPHGVSFTEGVHWEELRQFSIRQLRELGFGKTSMESSIMNEVNDFINAISETKGTPVTDLKERMLISVVNPLWYILSGDRFNQQDKKLIRVITKVNNMLDETLDNGGILLFAPWFGKWFPKISGYDTIAASIKDFSSVFRQAVDEHIETYSEHFQDDCIHAFLKKSYETTSTESPFYGKLGIDNLIASIADMYFATSDTTSTTLLWMMLYLAKFPTVQEKLHGELDCVTGNTRGCTLADRMNMPYTEAVIAETHRFASIAPQGLQHKALTDARLNDYEVPKDTIIIPNIYYIHYDPAIWGDPYNFRPDRFLSEDEKSFRKHEAVLPFSIGKRQCFGDTMARDTLFLWITNIFQKFYVTLDPNGPDNGLDPEPTVILQPKPFHLNFRDRSL